MLEHAPPDARALALLASAAGWPWRLTVATPDGVVELRWERGRLVAGQRREYE